MDVQWKRKGDCDAVGRAKCCCLLEDLVSYGSDDNGDDGGVAAVVASTADGWQEAVLAIAPAAGVDDTVPVDDGTLGGRSEADSPADAYVSVSCVVPTVVMMMMTRMVASGVSAAVGAALC